jgi:hypothetical protein
MKTILLLLLIIFFTTPSSVKAQEVCNLRTATAPVILNLKVGMSLEQVNSIFARNLKIKIKKSGQRTFFQNFIKKPAPPSLNGVRALYLRFFNRELYQFEIFYENKSEWQTLADFTNNLTANLNLPEATWENVKGQNTLNCSQITLVADKILNPRVEITDTSILAEIEKQRLAKKD